MLRPGDRYVAEEREGAIVLRLLPEAARRMTRDEVSRSLSESPIEFTKSRDQLKEEIR